MNVVILFLALTLPGQDPVTLRQPEPDLATCVAEVGAFLDKAEAGHLEGSYQASCVVVVPETINN